MINKLLSVVIIWFAALPLTVLGQALPKADAIIKQNLKALGNVKRLPQTDRTYEYQVFQNQQFIGTAQLQLKQPSALRLDLKTKGGTTLAVSAEAAWKRDADGSINTLTDEQSKNLRLLARLQTARLNNWKKLGVTAATALRKENVGDEMATVIEFRAIDNARLLYFFGDRTKHVRRIVDPTRKTTFHLSDYKFFDNVLEPAKMQIEENNEKLELALQKVVLEPSLNAALFDPPTSEKIDPIELLQQIRANQEEIDRRVSDYTFLEKGIQRILKKDGTTTETTNVYEIYPAADGKRIKKLVSKKGVPISPEKMAEEERRVAAKLIKAEEKYEEEKAKRELGENIEKEVKGSLAILQTSELISPRFGEFRGRKAIVVNFRPKPDFKSKNLSEQIYSKVAGLIWIDAEDKQIMRLEARFVDDVGVAISKIKPHSTFIHENARMNDGLWLPSLREYSLSVRVLFLSAVISGTLEFSDYKKFSAETKNYQLDKPKSENH